MPPEIEVPLPKVPEAEPGDPEDVSWALTTAEAMWTRGDHLDGIKWVRKAAEAASITDHISRALELTKAASSLAAVISHRSQVSFATNESETRKHVLPHETEEWVEPEWDESPTKRAPGESSPELTPTGDRKTTNFSIPAAVVAPRPSRPAPPAVHDAGIQTSQAVRVVVWRDANGVHVAPAGTVVSAITIEAVLVALQGGADLTAWLSAKDR